MQKKIWRLIAVWHTDQPIQIESAKTENPQYGFTKLSSLSFVQLCIQVIFSNFPISGNDSVAVNRITSLKLGTVFPSFRGRVLLYLESLRQSD